MAARAAGVIVIGAGMRVAIGVPAIGPALDLGPILIGFPLLSVLSVLITTGLAVSSSLIASYGIARSV